MKIKLDIRFMTGAFVLVASLALSPVSYSATLITGTTIQSATTGLNPDMGPEKAINGNGLTGGVPSLTASHGESFDSNWWTGWDGAVTEWQITVDLEGSYNLDTVQIWNYRENCCAGRGLRDVSIWVSPDENEANLVKLITNGSGLHDDLTGNFTLPQAPTGGDYFGFALDLSSVTNDALLSNARLFRIDGGTDLYGTPGAGGGIELQAGLAEIQFGGTPIPEPASGLFALTGLLGFVARRRRKS